MNLDESTRTEILLNHRRILRREINENRDIARRNLTMGNYDLYMHYAAKALDAEARLNQSYSRGFDVEGDA